MRLLIKHLCILALGGLASAAFAQHPIDVEQAAAHGEYLEALTDYDRMPKRISTTDATVAAAKSAWALSLPTRAITEFETALQDKKLAPGVRTQILLSRGIIEYQEGRYQVSNLYAEKALVSCAVNCAERAKILLLWGEGLAQMGSNGAAETKYLEALNNATPEESPEIAFRLGVCRLRLGKTDDARASFERVPLKNERTPDAIRYLATTSLEQAEYSNASFWLKKGRAEYSDNFLDSWVDYALLQIAVHDRSKKDVREIREAANKKYPPSDPWITLMNASAEAFEWEEMHK